MDTHSYVYKKEVDWSLLHQGVSIPVSIQIVFQNLMNKFIKKGQSKEIFIVLNGETYKVTLVNQIYDETKYPGRSDILQIRYNPNSDIAIKLRELFQDTFIYLSGQRNQSDKKKKYFKMPEGKKEYLAIYTTEYKDTFLFECIHNEGETNLYEEISFFDEDTFENFVNYLHEDISTSIVMSNRMIKVRKLNRAIGESLKHLYKHRCQICGNNFSQKYDVNIAEAHHIEPFTVSLNNNINNILILCPNHHTTIHRAEPVFLKRKAIFIYSNGLEEKIILNKHLY